MPPRSSHAHEPLEQISPNGVHISSSPAKVRVCARDAARSRPIAILTFLLWWFMRVASIREALPVAFAGSYREPKAGGWAGRLRAWWPWRLE